MTHLGFVVVEFNQASGQPRVDSYSGYGGDIYLDSTDARDALRRTREEMRRAGRNEKYELAELRLLSDGE